MITGLPPHLYTRIVWLDYETFNTADIKKTGAHVYAESPTLEVIMVQYALDDQPVKVLHIGGKPIAATSAECAELVQAIKDPNTLVVAHNAPFERLVTTAWIGFDIPLERLRCTMVQAYSHAFPGNLESWCKAANVPEHLQKLDKNRASALITRFCKPAPPSHKVDRYDATTHPAEWAEFCEYGRLDVEAMREACRRTPNLNWREKDHNEWMRDQRMNNRGIQIDLVLLEAGVRAAARYKDALKTEFRELQGGGADANNPTQRAQNLMYFQAQGIDIPDTKKATLTRYMKAHPAMNAGVKRMMEIILAANKTSTSKYKALTECICMDGRFKGGIQFNGAGRTRRMAARKFQLQNLPSRGIPKNPVILEYIDRIKQNLTTKDMGDQMLLASAALRGLIVTTPGKRLGVADLSNIEGRMAAWVSGEAWKIAAFGDYDAGTGPDLYKIGAVSIIGGDPWEVPDDIRNVLGKVPELAFQYGAGVNGGQQFACDFGIRMQDYWDVLTENVSPDLITKAEGNWDYFGHKGDVFEQRIDMTDAEWYAEWRATEVCKLSWRGRHPAITSMWRALADAAKLAIQYPNRWFPVGVHVKFICVNLHGADWLLMQLPSGSFVTYNMPRVDDKGGITYRGMSNTNQWIRLHTHGGKLFGNVCQSSSRDVMMGNMGLMEDAGWDLLLTVHDEVVAERADDGSFDGAEFAEKLARNPHWCRDLPLAAPAGITASEKIYRYGKF